MKFLTKKLVAALLTASILFPLSAKAAFECNVKIINVLIYADGTVNISHKGRNDYTVICYLNSTVGGVSPTTCALWTATVLAIKKKGGTATFYFGGDGTCATMGTYGNAPIPSYIGDITP